MNLISISGWPRFTKHLAVVFALIFLSFISSPEIIPSQSQAHSPALVVIKFDGPEDLSSTINVFMDRFMLEISQNETFEVVPEFRVKEVMEMIADQRVFRTEVGFAAEVGKRLDADTVIIGKIQKSGNMLLITAQIIDVSKRKIIYSASVPCEDCSSDSPKFLNSSSVLVQEILAAISPRSSSPQTMGETNPNSAKRPAIGYGFTNEEYRKERNKGILLTVGGAILVASSVFMLIKPAPDCLESSSNPSQCDDYDTAYLATFLVSSSVGGYSIVKGVRKWVSGRRGLHQKRMKEAGTSELRDR